MIKKIKRKKQMRLDELIKHVWDNHLYPETFKSNFNDFAHFDKAGKYQLIEQRAVNQAVKFTVVVEEREEEKKYIYRLPAGVDNADGWLIKTFDTDEPVQVTTGSPGYASRTPSFHFTDKEAADFPEDVQALFNACEKEEAE